MCLSRQTFILVHYFCENDYLTEIVKICNSIPNFDTISPNNKVLVLKEFSTIVDNHSDALKSDKWGVNI